VPIILRHNSKLELSRVEYSGAMRSRDIHDHAAYNAANPIWLGFDCISVIHADVEVSDLSISDVDCVFDVHRELFEPLKLMFMRRSAWVCESAAGQHLLSHWITKRNADQSPWTEVRQFDSFEAAGEWMLLSAENAAILKSGEGFKEIARFTSSAALTR
jgi:hypothetical protein